MLKMSELLDRSKYPHVWNCWDLKYLKSVSLVLRGAVGAGVCCLHKKGRVGRVSGTSAGCMPCRAGETEELTMEQWLPQAFQAIWAQSV